ncbi:methyl-accepting chemotaxis protein [Chengkuizengella axinellae]|uniref:Methyl-accepting chemotaxis protein n=1 Tax=Chengkuizengella axinellae TaxID=3064388 RepID=A0ABT9J4Z1_9BACL|nr:methyl-accepting chemotaxis protein [Chengkuizengella sp. 2205SS18-9]MDP5276700.1 methyl-accepting chemotaxis protein [Chengkuizengella sp. 2205SS18-9]
MLFMKLTKNMSTSSKLLLIFGVPLLFGLVSSIFLLNLNQQNVDHLTEALYETSLQTNTLILDADKDLYQALVGFQTLTRYENSNEYKEELREELESNVERANEKVDVALTIIKEHQLEGLTLSDNSSKEEATESSNVDTIENYLTEFKQQFQLWVKTTDAENPSYDLYLMSLPYFEDSRDKLKVSGDILNEYAENSIKGIHESNQNTKIWVYSLYSIIFVLITVSGLIFIKENVKLMKGIVRKIDDVKEGNLLVKPSDEYTKDEVGQMVKGLDVMVSKLRDLIHDIVEQSKTVEVSSTELTQSTKESSAASTHVAENIQTITEGIEVQNKTADETSRAVEEMAAGIQRIAESTTFISELSQRTDQQADKGNKVIAQLNNQIETMFKTIQQLSETVDSLNKRSDKIGMIIDDITGFATQTNLLSLNASIEAARAGEHGRGFSVVADEIKNLASGSLKSADNIQKLIIETQGEITMVSKNMVLAVEEAEKSGESMLEVSQDFHNISSNVKEIDTHIHETSAITEQLSASSEEVAASMEHTNATAHEIFSKTQNVAAATEEQLALMENMDDAAKKLKEIVNQLNQSVSSFRV